MTRLYVGTLEALIILGLVVMTTLTFTSTMIRLIPGQGGIYWAEEVSRYVTVWVVFLAAGLGIRFWVHLNVDLFPAMLPDGLQRALMTFCLALMLIFEGVLVWFGTVLTISNHAQQSASLQLPMSFAYAAIPTGGLIMTYETLRLIVREIRGLPRESLLHHD